MPKVRLTASVAFAANFDWCCLRVRGYAQNDCWQALHRLEGADCVPNRHCRDQKSSVAIPVMALVQSLQRLTWRPSKLGLCLLERQSRCTKLEQTRLDFSACTSTEVFTPYKIDSLARAVASLD